MVRGAGGQQGAVPQVEVPEAQEAQEQQVATAYRTQKGPRTQDPLRQAARGVATDPAHPVAAMN